MPFTSGLKKFASVVRPSGIGRYICVEKIPVIEPCRKVEILHQAVHQEHGAFQSVVVLIPVGDRILHQPLHIVHGRHDVIEAFAGRLQSVASAQRRFHQIARPDTFLVSLPEVLAPIRLHPSHARLSTVGAPPCTDRFKPMEIIAVHAAVANAQRFANACAGRHLQRRRSPGYWEAGSRHEAKPRVREKCRKSPSPNPNSRTGAYR